MNVLEILKPHCGLREWQQKPFAVTLKGRRFVAAVDSSLAIAIQSDAPAHDLGSRAHDCNPSFFDLPRSQTTIPVGVLADLSDHTKPVTICAMRVPTRALRAALETISKRAARVQAGTFPEPWPRLVLWTSSWRAVIAGMAKSAEDRRRIEAMQDREREVARG